MANGSKPVANVVTRQYKDGSIIYFEGDRSDYVYVLKSGRIMLSFIKIETGEEMKEMIKSPYEYHILSDLSHLLRTETGEASISSYKKMVKKPIDQRVPEIILDWLDRQVSDQK